MMRITVKNYQELVELHQEGAFESDPNIDLDVSQLDFMTSPDTFYRVSYLVNVNPMITSLQLGEVPPDRLYYLTETIVANTSLTSVTIDNPQNPWLEARLSSIIKRNNYLNQNPEAARTYDQLFIQPQMSIDYPERDVLSGLRSSSSPSTNPENSTIIPPTAYLPESTEYANLFRVEIFKEAGVLTPEELNDDYAFEMPSLLEHCFDESVHHGYRVINATDDSKKSIATEGLWPCIAILMVGYDMNGKAVKAALMHEDCWMPEGRVSDMATRNFLNDSSLAEVRVSLYGGDTSCNAYERAIQHRQEIEQLQAVDSRFQVGLTALCHQPHTANLLYSIETDSMVFNAQNAHRLLLNSPVDAGGNTPLIKAVQQKDVLNFTRLLNQGADSRVRNSQQLSVYDHVMLVPPELFIPVIKDKLNKEITLMKQLTHELGQLSLSEDVDPKSIGKAQHIMSKVNLACEQLFSQPLEQLPAKIKEIEEGLMELREFNVYVIVLGAEVDPQMKTILNQWVNQAISQINTLKDISSSCYLDDELLQRFKPEENTVQNTAEYFRQHVRGIRQSADSEETTAQEGEEPEGAKIS